MGCGSSTSESLSIADTLSTVDLTSPTKMGESTRILYQLKEVIEPSITGSAVQSDKDSGRSSIGDEDKINETILLNEHVETNNSGDNSQNESENRSVDVLSMDSFPILSDLFNSAKSERRQNADIKDVYSIVVPTKIPIDSDIQISPLFSEHKISTPSDSNKKEISSTLQNQTPKEDIIITSPLKPPNGIISVHNVSDTTKTIANPKEPPKKTIINPKEPPTKTITNPKEPPKLNDLESKNSSKSVNNKETNFNIPKLNSKKRAKSNIPVNDILIRKALSTTNINGMKTPISNRSLKSIVTPNKQNKTPISTRGPKQLGTPKTPNTYRKKNEIAKKIPINLTESVKSTKVIKKAIDNSHIEPIKHENPKVKVKVIRNTDVLD